MDFVEQLLDLDRDILLAVNGWHSPLADRIMLFFSGISTWIPLYVILAFLMFLAKWHGSKSFVHRYRSALPMWIIGLSTLLAMGVAFGLTDQLSNLIKHSVCRLRPSHEPLLAGLVRTPEGPGGRYGFSSGHAANTIGLAIYTSLAFCRRWYSIVIFLWSLIVCYSRMYLAKHYLGDIVGGILLGLLVGYWIHVLKVWLLDYLGRKWGARLHAGRLAIQKDGALSSHNPSRTPQTPDCQ